MPKPTDPSAASASAAAAAPKTAAFETLEDRRLMSALPFTLEFNGPVAGTVNDKDGQGTGFTAVQANKNGDQYQASLIDLDAGVLKLTTRGTAAAGGNAGTDNTLVNALETDFDGRSDFEITTKLVGGLGIFSQGYEQGGLSFGPDQDNYVKLVAIYHASDGPKLQFVDEYSNGSGGTESTISSSGISVGRPWSAVDSAELKIVGNAATGRLTASYRLDADAAWTQVPYTITVPSDKRAPFFSAASKAGLVAFDKSDAQDITVSYDRFEIKRITAGTGPSVTAMRPAAGATGVLRDSFVAVDLSLPNGSLDPSTVNAGSVYLRNNRTGALVSAGVNTTGGGDAITLTPAGVLDADTAYTFTVTSNVKDVAGAGFQAYSGTFTTGSAVAESNPRIAFDKTILSNTVGIGWTGATLGPDGKFYGVTSDGEIYRSSINADGTLSNPALLFSYENATGTKRLITGITFDTTQSTLTAYVSNGQYIEPGNDQNRVAQDWTGKITRFTGANLGTRADVIVGLPRSVYDHLNNQPSFGPDGRLYWVQASNSAMGAPDSTWGYRPERLLNGAVLAADVRSISSPLDVKTEDGGTYDPYAGGAKLKIYATGIRNGYDLVWTSDGRLYVPANGSAAGGNTPAGPNNSPPAINNVNQTEHDYLFNVVEGGYYGHPNPTRGEYVLNGGNPTGGPDLAEFAQYPVGTQPDANYRGYAYDFGLNVSPDGAIQYQSNGTQFGGALDGKLVVVRYSGGDDLIILDLKTDGTVNKAYTGSFGTVGMTDPLDVIQDPATGNLYVVEAGFRTDGGNPAGLRISLLKPVAAGAAATIASPRLRDSTLHFSDVKGDAAAGVPHTVTITNTGTADLAFPTDAFSITGGGASLFTLANVGSLPRKIAPGQSVSFDVLFTAQAKGIVSATLTIKSNDLSAPTRTIALRGLGTTGEGDQNEPSLQRVLDLYQIPVQTGDPDAETTDYPQQTVVSGSDEVLLQTLRKSGAGPVTIELLASFGTANDNGYSDTSSLAYYAAGGATKSPLFSIPKTQAQTVNPSAVAGNVSFSPSGDFGLVGTFNDFGPRDVWTEDAKNTWESNANERRKVRFFPLKDRAGNVVPNAYVFAFEEYDQATDQNDIVGVIRNVQPAAASPALGIENKDGIPFPDRLVFSRIRNQDAVVGNSFHDQSTLIVRNTGDAPLVLSSATLDNADFTILSGGTGGGPVTIAPGGSREIVVKFVYNNPTARRVLIRDGTLTLNTNDAAHPTQTIHLSGLWQSYSEEGGTGTSQEGNLNEIVRTLGYQIDVGPDTGMSNYNTGQNTGGARTAVGQENLSAFWQKAGTGSVTVQQVAAYHQQHDPSWNGDPNQPHYVPNTTFNWFYGSDAIDATTYRKVFKHNAADGQTLLPRLDNNATALAKGSFDPGNAAFGVSVDQAWHSDEARNRDRTAGGNAAYANQHAMRWFALRDLDGNVIPNAYLAAEDNVGDGGNSSYRGSNFDYQDNVYVLFNVKPVEGPSAPKSVSANSSDGGVMLSWAANKEGNLAGYDVFRSDSATGTFAKLNTSLLTATSFNDAALPVGQTGYYRVVAADYHGTGGTASTASGTRTSGPTLPAAAGSLAGTAPAYNRVTLTWADNSNNEAGFRIERANGSGAFAAIATAGANATTFTDTAASARMTYRYRVVAFNAVGDAAASNVAQVVTPADDAVVAAPSTLTASQVRYNAVGLTWADNSENETSFRVERRIPGGAFAAITTLPADSTSYSDATVTAETGYEYRVVAFNAVGTSPASNVVAVTTPSDPSHVDAPAGLAAGAVAHNRVSLSWIDNSDNETGFRIERAADGGAFAEIGSVAAGVTGFADNAVSPTASYRYRVVAFNGLGQSAASNVVSVTTPADPSVIAPPANLRPTSVGAFRIALAWDDNSANETGFRVERSTAGGAFLPLATVGADETTYADAAAQPRTSYRYRVVAVNASGTSPASNELAATTPGDPTVIAAPTQLAATAASYAQVNLAWRDNADNETGFVLQRRLLSGGDWADLAPLGTDAQSFIDTGLSGSTGYAYRVAARNNLAQSAWSAEATVTTPSADAYVSDDIGGATGSTAVVTPRSDFDLTVSGGDVGNNADALRFAHKPVVGDFDYRVRLDSFDKADPASAAGLMVRDALAPGAKNLFLRASGQVRLTYRDQVNGSTAGAGLANPGVPVWLRLVRSGDAFTAYYGDDGQNWTQLAQVTVQMPQTLRLGVAAAGYSDAASTARFRDLGVNQQTPPAAVSGLAAAPQGAASVRLTWSDVADNELGYRVERRDGGTTAWSPLATLDEPAEQYVDATVRPGRSYDYRVVIFNDFGQTPGEVVTADVPSQTPPTPDTGGNAGGENNGNNGTSQNVPKPTSAPSFNWSVGNGQAVEQYRIERRAVGGEWATLTSVRGTVASLRDASAEPGATYEYRVVAVNGDAESEPSQAVRFTTAAAPQVARPAASAAAVGDTAIRVTWTDQSEGESNFVVQRRLLLEGRPVGGWATRATPAAESTAFVDRDLSPGASYEYRVRADGNGRLGAWSNSAAATTEATPTYATDIVGTADGAQDGEQLTGPIGGATALSPGRHYDVQASGRDVWGFEDEFTFVSRPISGDFDLAVRVTGLDGGDAGRMAGLMARASLSPGSRNVFVKVRPDDVRLTSRRVDDGQTTAAGDATIASPRAWLRLQRRGDVLVGYASADGRSWTEIGRATVRLGDTALVGLAASARSADGRVEAKFRDLTDLRATDRLPDPPRALSVSANSGGGVSATWTDAGGGRSGFAVQRRVGGGLWQALGFVAAGTTSYDDPTAASGTAYGYRVAGENAAGVGAYGPEVTVVA